MYNYLEEHILNKLFLNKYDHFNFSKLHIICNKILIIIGNSVKFYLPPLLSNTDSKNKKIAAFSYKTR